MNILDQVEVTRAETPPDDLSPKHIAFFTASTPQGQMSFIQPRTDVNGSQAATPEERWTHWTRVEIAAAEGKSKLLVTLNSANPAVRVQLIKLLATHNAAIMQLLQRSNGTRDESMLTIHVPSRPKHHKGAWMPQVEMAFNGQELNGESPAEVATMLSEIQETFGNSVQSALSPTLTTDSTPMPSAAAMQGRV